MKRAKRDPDDAGEISVVEHSANVDPDDMNGDDTHTANTIATLFTENFKLKEKLTKVTALYQELQNTVAQLSQADSLPKPAPAVADDAAAADRQEEDEEQNPLLINVVVKNLMRFVAGSDLTNCRLVCKLWNEEATPQTLKRKLISIDLGDYDSCLDFCHLIETTATFSKFERVKFIPFHPKPTPSHASRQRLKHKIFSMIGYSLKHLDWLIGPNLIHESNLREYLSCCPNLESLSWSMYNLKLNSSLLALPQEPAPVASPSCPLLLPKCKKLHILPPPKSSTFENSGSNFITHDLFRIMPNLEELNCDFHQSNLPVDLDNGLGFIIKPLCLNRPPHLTRLFLQEIVTDYEIIRLTNAGFRLQSLCLINTSYHVQRFLISLKDTLEDLTLVMYNESDIPIIKSLLKLKYFASPLLFFNEINARNHSIRITGGPFQSSENPTRQELVSLKFKADDQSFTEDLLNPVPNDSLRELGLFHFEEPTLRRIISSCPNLRKLDLVLPCSPNTALNKLHCIWSDCLNLYELTLRFSIDNGSILNNVQVVASGTLNLDSEFTGYTFEECRSLRPHAIFCPDDCDCLKDIVRTKASITNLTKLERLEVNCSNGTFVTDLTVRECFIKMDSLTYLYLHNALLGPTTVMKIKTTKPPSICIVLSCDNELEDVIGGGDDDDDDDDL